MGNWKLGNGKWLNAVSVKQLTWDVENIKINRSSQTLTTSFDGNVRFLADRANGRAMLQCCVCRRPSVSTECIVAKRCVLEQKLLLTAYRKSYMRNRLVPKWMTLTFIYSYQGHVNNCATFDVEYLANRWRHVTPNVLWGSTVGYPSDSLSSCLLALLCSVYSVGLCIFRRELLAENRQFLDNLSTFPFIHCRY